MRCSWRATLAITACACLCGTASAESGEEARVIAVAQAAADAIRDGSIAAVEELFAPDVTVIDSGGRVATRDTILNNIRSGALRYEVFLNRDATARLYGDTAIVVGTTAVKGRFLDQPFTVDVRFTDVLVRVQGKWKLVATHASRIAGQ
jgi:ketosteroid isomerase-like protein